MYKKINISNLFIVFFILISSAVFFNFGQNGIINVGDTLFPYSPNVSFQKSAHLWYESNLGAYNPASYNSLNLFHSIFIKTIFSFGISLEIISKFSWILVLFLLLISSYSLFNLIIAKLLPDLNSKKINIISFFSSLIFVFNLHFIIQLQSAYFATFIPIIGGQYFLKYFIIFYDDEKVKIKSLFFLSLSSILLFLVVPVGLAAVFFSIFYLVYFFIKYKKVYFLKLFFIILFIVLANSFLIFPVVYQFTNINILSLYEGQDVSVLNFVKNYSSIKNTIFNIPGYMPISAFAYLNYYINNTFFYITSALFVLLAMSICFLKGKINRLLLCVLIIFLLINVVLVVNLAPPTGFIFQFFWDHLSFFHIFRNPYKFQVNVLLVLSIFSSVVIYKIYDFKQKMCSKLFGVLILALLIIGNSYPLFSGQMNYFFSGSKLPFYYNELHEHFKEDKLVGRVLILPKNPWYIDFEWNSFNKNNTPNILTNLLGKQLIYSEQSGYGFTLNFIEKNVYSTVYNNYKNTVNLAGILNINYLLNQKDILNGLSFAPPVINNFSEKKQFGKLDVFKVPIEYFLPHFYTPQDIISTNQVINTLPQIVSQPNYRIRSAIYFENQNKERIQKINQLPKVIENSPILEFKKVNPTKYKIIVHQAKDDFPLVFSESLHNSWKVYLTDFSSNLQNLKSQVSDYKILEGNEKDQASSEELEEFIEKGWVSALGDGKGKEIKHKRYLENGKEELDYIEKYKIDFVSKNFQDTIQNDNLPKGYIWDTWFRKPLPEENHLMVNGYANSWWIDIDEIKKSGEYIQNPDGSIDFEITVEFWPQRLFYLGLFISGTTLLSCFGYLGYGWRRKRKLIEID